MARELAETLARSRQQVEVNRGILAASRRRIAASRRLLNPHFALAGASPAPGPESVRALISNGWLFPLSEGMSVRSGAGTRNACLVCHERIDAAEVEYEVRSATRGPFYCHLPCFTAWKRESLDITGVWPV
jgi:hypothetical protein